MTYYLWRCTTISELMINEQIRDKEVRLIGEDGEQLGLSLIHISGELICERAARMGRRK